LKRGDLITVSISGDYGEPRPALIVQSDFLSQTDSILVCLLTTTLREAPLYRLTIPEGQTTGLRQPLQIMVDKIMAVRRDRCGDRIGSVDASVLSTLGEMLAFVVGVSG
jgi:mRNA interferase MazF